MTTRNLTQEEAKAAREAEAAEFAKRGACPKCPHCQGEILGIRPETADAIEINGVIFKRTP